MDNKGFDVAVIGSGPGGSACALGLARRGLKVIILEEGPRFNPSKDYQLHIEEWDMKGFPHKVRDSYSFGDEQIISKDLEHLRSRSRAKGLLNPYMRRRYYEYFHTKGVGGSTLQYQGEAHRFHPYAFKMKTIYGVGRDWPISYNDIEPFYMEAERILGVAGPKNHPFIHRTNSILPPHRISYASQKILKASSRINLTMIPNTVAILSRPYNGRPPCNYCNGCTYGCPRKDKGSADVTFIPAAEATGNCTIKENVKVSRLVINKGRIAEVLYYDMDGKEHALKAKAFVVACGAIETPRLLLNSGLSNKNIGKNFMETLFFMASAYHPERIDSYRGIPIDSEIIDYICPSPKTGLPFVGGFRLFPTAGASLSPVKVALNYCRGFGDSLKREVEKYFGHTISVGGIGEFLPNINTFVTIDREKKDSYGIPLAKIQSILGENEIKILNFMSEKCKELLFEAGAEEIVETISTYDLFIATHVFGTCLMGTTPESSVVDATGRSHDITNLFISDASVLPSSGGGSSPSLTVAAIGLKTAEHIARMMENSEQKDK
jgi:choline dehydrogenase-like flavoprotein